MVMFTMGSLGCRSELFAMGAVTFYMKGLNLSRQTKLLFKTLANAQNAVGNFLCYLSMWKLNPNASAE
jgi:hypothetical protein